VPKDYERAYKWLNVRLSLSYWLSDTDAKIEHRGWLNQLERQLTPEQVDRAQALSVQCLASKFKNCGE